MEVVWLQRLTVHRWRTVRPGTHLEFAPGINVLLGKNGTGKTHLLDLIVAVVRGDFRPFAREAIDVSLVLTVGDRRLEGRFSKDRAAESCICVGQLHRGDKAHAFTMGACEEITPGLEQTPVLQSCLWAALDALAPFARRRGIRPFNSRPVELLERALRMDEGLEVFSAIVARTGEERARLFDQRVRIGWSEHHHAENEDGEGLGWTESEPITLGTQAMPPLATRFAKSAGMIAVQLDSRQRQSGHTTVYHGVDLSFQPQPDSPTLRDAESMSFGQKRLFTWLYLSAATPSGPLVADELTNGMHHSLIEACLAEIGPRQAFFATQEPLLLDYLRWESAQEMALSLVLCRSDAKGKWDWSHPTADEAQTVFRSYEVDPLHVSEILRIHGLW